MQADFIISAKTKQKLRFKSPKESDRRQFLIPWKVEQVLRCINDVVWPSVWYIERKSPKESNRRQRRLFKTWKRCTLKAKQVLRCINDVVWPSVWYIERKSPKESNRRQRRLFKTWKRWTLKVKQVLRCINDVVWPSVWYVERKSPKESNRRQRRLFKTWKRWTLKAKQVLRCVNDAVWPSVWYIERKSPIESHRRQRRLFKTWKSWTLQVKQVLRCVNDVVWPSVWYVERKSPKESNRRQSRLFKTWKSWTLKVKQVLSRKTLILHKKFVVSWSVTLTKRKIRHFPSFDAPKRWICSRSHFRNLRIFFFLHKMRFEARQLRDQNSLARRSTKQDLDNFTRFTEGILQVYKLKTVCLNSYKSNRKNEDCKLVLAGVKFPIHWSQCCFLLLVNR